MLHVSSFVSALCCVLEISSCSLKKQQKNMQNVFALHYLIS